MSQEFKKCEDFFIKTFNNVGGSLNAIVEIPQNLCEQYSGVTFRFNDILNYTFHLEFQKENYEKLMYGIKRVNNTNKKAYSFLEKNIKSNFCSHFCQSDETSAKSSFLVCATWKLYKYGFCKGKCSNRCFEAEVRELINNLKDFFHANELTPWGFWKNDLNKEILMKYKILPLSNLNVSEETKKNLSCPMLIHLGLEYKPKEGVFIIGQETQNSVGKSGWGTPENKFGSSYKGFENYISKACDLYGRESILMETQSQWLFDNMQDRTTTPFFRAVKEISNARNGADFYYKSKFVWDELIAMDYRGRSLENLPNQDEKNEVIKYSINKLKSELQLTEPKYAIFFTGFKGVYKKALDQLFGQNVDMMPKYNGNNDIKYFKWNGVECFLTDHPRTLLLDGRWNVVTKLSKIVNK